jgi:hypothetical protein
MCEMAVTARRNPPFASRDAKLYALARQPMDLNDGRSVTLPPLAAAMNVALPPTATVAIPVGWEEMGCVGVGVGVGLGYPFSRLQKDGSRRAEVM